MFSPKQYKTGFERNHKILTSKSTKLQNFLPQYFPASYTVVYFDGQPLVFITSLTTLTITGFCRQWFILPYKWGDYLEIVKQQTEFFPSLSSVLFSTYVL